MDLPNKEHNPERIEHLKNMGMLLILFFSLVGVIATTYKIDQDETLRNNTAPLTSVSDPFQQISLEAKAAVVWDVNQSKALFTKNAETVLPLASLTKVMTALVARESTSPTTIVVVDKNALAEESDNGLFSNERWKLGDLLNLTLIASSNDGAHAIANAIGGVSGEVSENQPRKKFVDIMNRRGRELGLEKTFFINETGLDSSSDVAGAYGSAKDFTRLFEYVLRTHGDLLEVTRRDSFSVKSLSNLSHKVENTNKNLAAIPLVIASKTGYTPLSGGNLVIALDAGINRPIIITVLGSSYEGRFTDAEALAWATLEYFSSPSSQKP
ncbi:MAG: serine hydrolase [bacterium]|nr:serine hydrolase [bacterium]